MSEDAVCLGTYPEDLLQAVRLNWPGVEFKELTIGSKKMFKAWISKDLYEKHKNVPVVGSRRNPIKK